MRKTAEQKRIEELEDKLNYVSKEKDAIHQSFIEVEKLLLQCKQRIETLTSDNEKLVAEMDGYEEKFQKFVEKKTEKGTVIQFMEMLSKFDVKDQCYIMQLLTETYMEEIRNNNESRRKSYQETAKPLAQLEAFLGTV